MTMLSKSAEVVVIGAGVRGAAIAYHLARAGVDVLVVDRGFICSGTSGATFAMVNVSGKSPGHYTSLSLASADLYPTLGEELDCDIEYRRGNLIYRVVEHEDDLPAAEAFAQRLNAIPGISMSLLSVEQVRELEPAVSPAMAGGLVCDQDGRVNPFKLTFGYAAAARRLGARFMLHTEVQGIQVQSGKVRSIVTEHCEISCDWVVNAAGIDTPTIGAWLGLKIPLVPHRAGALTTQPLPGLINQPLGVFRPYIEIIPTNSGPVLILVSATNDLVGRDNTIEFNAMTNTVLKRVVAMVPALGDAEIIRGWSGLRPMPIDGLPIMGPVPGIDGLLIATGHSGYTLAQITGKTITELIIQGRSTTPMEAYALGRFSEGRYAFPMQAYQYGALGRDTDPTRVAVAG